MLAIGRYFFCLAFIVLCFLLHSCYARKNIVVSKSLENNCEKWQVNTHAGKYGIRKVSFNFYSIASIQKLDSPSLKENTQKFFSIAYPGRVDQQQKRKAYLLGVTDNKDTIELLLMLWQKTTTKEPGLFTKLIDKKAKATEESWKEAEGFFKLEGDTASWIFSVGPYTGSLIDGSPFLVTTGELKNGSETFKINPVTEFIETLAGQTTKGLSVQDNKDEEIATIQLLGKQRVWMKKDLPKKTEFAIAAFFSVIVSTWEK